MPLDLHPNSMLLHILKKKETAPKLHTLEVKDTIPM